MKTRAILGALLLLVLVATRQAQIADPTLTVLHDQLTVAPKQEAVMGFSIKPASRGARVAGSFRASGEGDHDIEVSLLDAEQFESYQHGHQTPAYYRSGRVAVGQIDLTLHPGTYYLVFNNKFSSHWKKVVAVTIRFRYYSGGP